MNVNSVCLCVFVLSLLFECGHTNSTCPDIFHLYTEDGGKLYGQITLHPVGKVSSVQLSFTFEANLNGSDVEIFPPDDVLRMYNRGEKVRYRFYFPMSLPPGPKVTEIAVNGDIICTGPGDPAHSTFIQLTANEGANDHKPQTPQLMPQMSVNHLDYVNTFAQNIKAYAVGQGVPKAINNWESNLQPQHCKAIIQPLSYWLCRIPEYHYSEECGVVAGNNEISRLIYSGLSYERGEIPWLVAIYKKVKKNIQFICGGTLVSNRHVVTAAHCLRGSRTSLSEKDFVVKLGVHDLNGRSDNIVVTAGVINATIHDFFNSSSLKNDIMILTLNRSVWFNDFIRPACLWSGNTDLLLVVGATGVVAGWGNEELDEPQMLRVPIVSTKECRASTPDLHKLTSYNTLCAGSRDGSGPCTGDSGGGLYLLDGGKWRLRGIVSHALQTGIGPIPCNLNEYVVYTDAAQYLPWIRNILSQK